MEFKFTAKSEAECKSFLKIREADGAFQTIEDFIREHPTISEDALMECVIDYRGTEKSIKQDTDDYCSFSESMPFVNFTPPVVVVDQSIKAAIYFMEKAIECLQFARFFTMKSALILDTDYNIRWSQGYGPQYLFRCIYFGTATTWYSNAFDHILQTVYWGKKLYTSVEDRDGNPYNDTWDVKEIMTYCTYEFVVGELKARGQTELRKILTSCSGLIEEVRMWANYIKHKGGIDYKYLMPENPFELYIMPQADDASNPSEGAKQFHKLDEQYKIKDFKSPVEIDIDEKLATLVVAHTAIYNCIGSVINDIDFGKYQIKLVP